MTTPQDKGRPPGAPLAIEPGPRRRRVTPTVQRLEKPRVPTWAETGELRLEELAGEGSGLFELPAPSIALELAPQRRARLRGPREQRLRLATAVGLLLVTLIFFAEALAGGLRRATSGEPADGWRAIPLRLSSMPSGAQVFLDDQLAGRTPFATSLRCRGRRTFVRVEAPDHAPWLWTGICPYSGALVLRAELQSAL